MKMWIAGGLVWSAAIGTVLYFAPQKAMETIAEAVHTAPCAECTIAVPPSPQPMAVVEVVNLDLLLESAGKAPLESIGPDLDEDQAVAASVGSPAPEVIPPARDFEEEAAAEEATPAVAASAALREESPDALPPATPR